MQRLRREGTLKYDFDWRHEPVLRVSAGEAFLVETEDASSGQVRSTDVIPYMDDLPYRQGEPGLSNPVTGPIYVEGANKGDLLEIEILSVVPDAQGYTRFGPNDGPLRDSKRWAQLGEPCVEIIKHLPGPSGTTRDGKGFISDRLTWDLHPFIGTIALAPEREVMSSGGGQGPSGGNLDCRDVCEGTKIYINCRHDGGLLFLGDVHGSQGDTEFTEAADETRAEVSLRCRIIPQKRIPFMRLEKPDSIISLHCYRPMEIAVETAITNLMDWMVGDYGLTQKEAYLHVGLNPDFRIHVYQMARCDNLEFTVGAELPKRYLPNPQ